MIFFCGDNHGHFDHIIEAVLKHRPDAIVQNLREFEDKPKGSLEWR